MTARLEFPNTATGSIRVVFPTGSHIELPREQLEIACLEVLSHPFPNWPRLIGPAAQALMDVSGFLPAGSTEAMQVITSLFHLTYRLYNIEQTEPSIAHSPALVQRLFHQRLRDLLPPKNSLFIPARELQERIVTEDRNGELFKFGRLYKCTVRSRVKITDTVQKTFPDGNNGQDATVISPRDLIADDWEQVFHYRPYNTPILGLWKLRAVERLNSDLRDEYESLEDD